MGRRLSIASIAVLSASVLAAQGVGAASKYPPLRFSAPTPLTPATVGQGYQFSFCQPTPSTGRCSAQQGATNPSGGFGQYYEFSVKGRLPSGLRLSARSGMLTGTLSQPGASKPFTVCAVDADKRRPGAQKPACTTTSLTAVVATTTTLAAAAFGGAWGNGTFQTTALAPNACGSSASGTVSFTLTQTGVTVTGAMNYSVTNYVANANAPAGCANLAGNGAIPLTTGTVAGSTLTGSGFTLTKTSETAMTGTFTGGVQGLQLTVAITAGR